ncbi:MAG TPA: S8 family serine peptidase [Thermoanaerobaculia bacterium]
MDGTSMATPHVAGLAALLFQARPRTTADDVERAIFRSCRILPPMSPDRAGRGFPNASRAFDTCPASAVEVRGVSRRRSTALLHVCARTIVFDAWIHAT